MPEIIRVSTLGKTWIFDLDGTVVRHNGYRLDGEDTLLEGAGEFLRKIPAEDMVIFLTSRTREEAPETEDFLRRNGLRYDAILYGAPYGERILINDRKPSGLTTAIAVNTERDVFPDVVFQKDESL